MDDVGLCDECYFLVCWQFECVLYIVEVCFVVCVVVIDYGNVFQFCGVNLLDDGGGFIVVVGVYVEYIMCEGLVQCCGV